MPLPPSRWTGDLADDCVLRDGEFLAHVEKMGRSSWWCAIYGPGFEWNASGVTVGDECMWWTSGRDARQFCEWFIDMVKLGTIDTRKP